MRDLASACLAASFKNVAAASWALNSALGCDGEDAFVVEAALPTDPSASSANVVGGGDVTVGEDADVVVRMVAAVVVVPVVGDGPPNTAPLTCHRL